ncbi:MAG: AAA family ATPase [Desulfobacterales bacterium]|nr:AAA family ATPase [Desulfobacterales bacterium]
MCINKLNVQNFTVFEEIEIELCKNINIFIGENGTGKTHLLKLIYGVIDIYNSKNRHDGKSIYLWQYFLSANGNNKYFVRDISKACDIEIKAADYEIIFNVYKEDNNRNKFENNFILKTSPTNSIKKQPDNIVFIPAKEMLSHSKGFLALEREREIPFDKTLINIISKAELGEAKQISDFQSNLIKILSKIIDGNVIFENDTFYVIKNNGLKIEFSMEAEGFRKFGLIWKLIKNGLIEKNTLLLWDEPEANINPQLMPVLVDIILEMQRNGVQIFIATHDYNLAKYFEINRKNNDEVLYHCLYKTNSKGVKCSKATNYKNILNNPIEKANEKLYNEILEKAPEDIENGQDN